MSILGYLGHLQSPDIGAVLPLHSLVPYQVKELFGMACQGSVQRAQLEVMGNSVPTAYVSQKRDKQSNLQSNCMQGVWKLSFCRGAGVTHVLRVLHLQVLVQKLLCVPCLSAGVRVCRVCTQQSLISELKLNLCGADEHFCLSSFLPQVPFNAVALRVIHTDVAPSNIMYAVNASWVGLCCIPEEVRCQTDGPVLLTQTPVCDCLGFGEHPGALLSPTVF